MMRVACTSGWSLISSSQSPIPLIQISHTLNPKPRSGTQACVCKVIPGKLPKAAQPEIIGLAAGELVTALEKVDIGDLKSPTPPYYEIYDVHHAINKEKFLAEVSQTLNPKPPMKRSSLPRSAKP